MFRARNVLLLTLPLLLVVQLACRQPGVSPGAEAQPPEESTYAGANETFLAEDLDVERFVAIFEGESREVSVHRDGIVDALRIAKGTAIADIGSGTGLFLPAFDRAVGKDGRVYAVEVAPKFLVHLEKRVRDEALGRVEVVTGNEKSVALPAASVDVAFVCDTYHHFEYPQSTLASIRSALRPGGTLIVVDFERIPGKTSDWLLDHMRAGKEVFIEEISAAGFQLVEEIAVDGLEENYMLRFRSR